VPGHDGLHNPPVSFTRLLAGVLEDDYFLLQPITESFALHFEIVVRL